MPHTMPDVRKSILESARSRFLTDGLKKTTMEQIARDRRISKKTLYEHFRSKDEIWRELIVIESRKSCEYLKTHLPTDLSPLYRLERLIGYYVRRRVLNQSNVPATVRLSAPLPAIVPDSADDTSKQLREEALQQAFPTLVAELITVAQATDEVVPGEAGLLAEMVVGAVIATATSPKYSNDCINLLTTRIRTMLSNVT